jgi:hypothetical protein
LLKITANPELLTLEEEADAVQLIMERLGRAELEIVGSYPSPLAYTVKDEHRGKDCAARACTRMTAEA